MNMDRIKRTLTYIATLQMEPYASAALQAMLAEDLDAYDLAVDFLEADSKAAMPMLVVDLVLDILEDEADAGNGMALNDLGVFWLLGRGGRKDPAKARDYFKKAVLFGSEQALENLGFCALQDHDYETAYNCFVKGALLMQPFAYYQLALMYEAGEYVSQDKVQAFEMFYTLYRNLNEASAAFLGPELCVKLAECFMDGIGTDQDPFLAVDFLDEAWFMLEAEEDPEPNRQSLKKKVSLLKKQGAHLVAQQLKKDA